MGVGMLRQAGRLVDGGPWDIRYFDRQRVVRPELPKNEVDGADRLGGGADRRHCVSTCSSGIDNGEGVWLIWGSKGARPHSGQSRT